MIYNDELWTNTSSNTSFPVDVIALSCARYRLSQQETNPNAYSLYETPVDQVTPEDYQMAAKIRKYYGEPLMVKAIKNEYMSSFSKDLANLLSMDPTVSIDLAKYSGILYKLPYFYYEDLELDELVQLPEVIKTQESSTLPKQYVSSDRYDTSLTTFNFVKRTHVRTRATNEYRYWLINDNIMYCLPIDGRNPLIDLFEKYCASGVIRVKSFTYVPKHLHKKINCAYLTSFSLVID